MTRTTLYTHRAIILATATDQKSLNDAAQQLDPGMGNSNIWVKCNSSGLANDSVTHYLTTTVFTDYGWKQAQQISVAFPNSSLIPWNLDNQPDLISQTLSSKGLKIIK